MKYRFLAVCLIVLSFISCKKNEEDVIDQNNPPPDQSIPDITIENYVNRVYISVLGREPDSVELYSGYTMLRSANVSAQSRNNFLDIVFANPQYKESLYDKARADLLNNQDTTEIYFQILIFQQFLGDTTYQLFWPALQYEVDRLELLRSITNDLSTDSINEIGMFRRCTDNYYYDQINMGTENFVVATFQNFLLRYPIDNELQNAKAMVDGGNAVLFFQSGSGKSDFLNIFFHSDDYYEGQVRKFYKRFLYREPTSVEMKDETNRYKTLGYITLQKDILSSNEYIGI